MIGFACGDAEGPRSSKRLFAGQAGEKLNVKSAELCVDGCGKADVDARTCPGPRLSEAKRIGRPEADNR